MKAISWNVNSVRMRMPLLLRLINKEQPDVLMLQETKCTDDKFPEIDGYHHSVFGQKSYNGVAILSRDPLEDVERFGEDARCIKGVLGDVCFMSIYVPCGEGGIEKYEYKRRFLTEAIQWIAMVKEKYAKVVVGGDFNVAMTDADVQYPEDFAASVLCRPDVRLMMERLTQVVDDVLSKDAASVVADPAMSGGALEGVYEDINIDVKQKKKAVRPLMTKNPFTWWDYRAPNKGVRIDYILSSGVAAPQRVLKEYRRMEIREFVEGKETITKPSDHAPVVVEVLNGKDPSI